LFGATFIDHNSRTVLNGSVLGKDFAANSLGERFPDLAIENRENKRATQPAEMTLEDAVRSAQGALSDNQQVAVTLPAILDLSSIGDAAGSLFSILTPNLGGQTDNNKPVRRLQPKKPKPKKGLSR
jgi:hypothetical protein